MAKERMLKKSEQQKGHSLKTSEARQAVLDEVSALPSG